MTALHHHINECRTPILTFPLARGREYLSDEEA